MIIGCDKACGASTGFHTGRAADPMDVVFRAVRHIEVNDMSDVGHVNPTRRNIRRDQYPKGPAPESFQSRPSLWETAIAMDDRHLIACGADGPAHPVRAMLRPGEDEHGILICRQQFQQQIDLVFLRRVMQGLIRAIGGRRWLADHDPCRVLHAGPRQVGQVRRHRRREQQLLPLFRKRFKNLVDLRREAHVEHPVCFIEDQDLHVLKVDGPVPHVVEKTARRCHDDIGPLTESAHLRVHVRPADHCGGEDPPASSQLIDGLLGLDGQFPSRRQDETFRMAFRHGGQALDHRNHERRRFARPRLRASQHITAF